jgi:hypothetical protein
VGLAIIVVVDSERTEVVTAARERQNVAVFFTGREGEEAKIFFLRIAEVEWLRHYRDGSSSEVTVGKPYCVEWIGCVCRTATVYEV